MLLLVKSGVATAPVSTRKERDCERGQRRRAHAPGCVCVCETERGSCVRNVGFAWELAMVRIRGVQQTSLRLRGML